MIRFFLVSTFMVSSSFSSFAMNNGKLPPQGGNFQRPQRQVAKVITSMGNVQKEVCVNNTRDQVYYKSPLTTRLMERRLPHVQSLPDLNNQLSSSKEVRATVSDSARSKSVNVQTSTSTVSDSSRSESSSSTSSSPMIPPAPAFNPNLELPLISTSTVLESSRIGSSSSTSSSPMIPPAPAFNTNLELPLISTSTVSDSIRSESSSSTASTSTVSTADAQPNTAAEGVKPTSVSSSSQEKPLTFRKAIKNLPEHLRTRVFKDEFKELDEEFQTVELVQSVAGFSNSKEIVEGVLNFLRGLNALPEEYLADDVVRLVNLARLSLKNYEVLQLDYLNESVDRLKNGDAYASVSAFIQVMGMLPKQIISSRSQRALWERNLKVILKSDMVKEDCDKVIKMLGMHRGDSVLDVIQAMCDRSQAIAATTSKASKIVNRDRSKSQ